MTVTEDSGDRSGSRAGFTLVLACIVFSTDAARADDTERRFAFRGFGTAGLTHSTLHQADFVGSPIQPDGAGFSKNWAPGVDSKIGLQLDFDVIDRLEGVIQVVSQHRAESGYQPRIEWANLKYQVNMNLSVRAGRIILPAFMVSESRLVGYSNVWVRPPVESYAWMPFTNSDGLDVSYRMPLSGASNTVQFLYGNLSAKAVSVTSEGTELRSGKFKNIVGITDTYERGDWIVRAAAITGQVKGQESGQDVETRFRFFNVGAAYDRGDWFVQGELTRCELPVFTAGNKVGYLTAGMRLGAWTPYLIYSSGKPIEPVPSALANDQSTVAAGIRWDLARNTALKLQFDHVRLKESAGGSGTFINTQPDFSPGSRANIISVVADFVF